MAEKGYFPESIYNKLPQEQKEKIEAFAKKYNIYKASQKFCKEAGMAENSLYRTLRKRLDHTPVHASKQGYNFKRATKLTDEEKEFLKDLREGTKGVEDIARLVAVKVFEKMLKYPDDFKFYDFYQAQMLKLKKEEQANKNTLAMELINRMFGGQLPPTHCPNCGTEVIKISQATELQEGEIIKND